MDNESNKSTSDDVCLIVSSSKKKIKNLQKVNLLIKNKN